MGPGVPVHIGIVPGAQLPGEEDGGAQGVHLLAQLLPEVESFQAETQRLRDTIAHERRNASFQREINADLRNELKAERSHSFDQSMKLSELERRCKRAEKLLSKIPQEELDKLLPKQKGLER